MTKKLTAALIVVLFAASAVILATSSDDEYGTDYATCLTEGSAAYMRWVMGQLYQGNTVPSEDVQTYLTETLPGACARQHPGTAPAPIGCTPTTCWSPCADYLTGCQ